MLREVKDVIEACAAQQTALVVLSTGGSAAPAVADLLVSLGCDAAVSTHKSANKIAEFNSALLESSGGAVNDWAGFNTKWLGSPKATEFLNRALELLKAEFDGSYLSVMQDATTARLLPFWNVVFDRAGILPRYLFMVEDPSAVAEELSESRGVEPAAGQLIWLRAVLDAEAQSRGRLRAFIDAARLSHNPVPSMNSLAGTLQLTFPRDVESSFASDDAGLQQFRELVRRSREKATSHESAPATVEWVSVAHEILGDWAANGEKGDARTVLDALREAFDEAVPIFHGMGQGSAAKSAEVRRLEQELAALQGEFQRAQESARRIEESGKEVEKELRGRVSHLESELALRTAEANETLQSLKDAQVEISFTKESGKEVEKELRGRISHLESELALRTAEANETLQSLKDAQVEISFTTQELVRSREAARVQIGELRKASEEKAEAFEEAQEQLRARYSEIVTLTRMLATETSMARRLERTAERLGGISRALERGASKGFAGWLERILPWSWHIQRVKRRLEREGLFDCGAYLAANPDVQEAGVDPLRHYLSHGALEGRPLGID